MSRLDGPRCPRYAYGGASGMGGLLVEGFVGSGWWGGGACGIKISAVDRDRHLVREWGTVRLLLPGGSEPISVNIDKHSMWEGTCRELIHKSIKDWFVRTKKFPWPKGSPPQVRLVPCGPRSFAVSFVEY